MASAASSGWRHLRAQRWPVQALVWLFALPVPAFLWALQRRHDRAPAVAFAVVVTLACIGIPLAAGSSASTTPADRVTTDRVTTDRVTTDEVQPTTTSRHQVSTTTTAAVTSTTAAAPTTTTPPPPVGDVPPAAAPSASAEPARLLSAVRVEAEAPDAGYDRDLFNHWGDADGDGCDTRCEVLAAERLPTLPGLPDGGWISHFDAVSTADPADLDIDHLVPLGEAWRSGAAAWDPQRRAAFANDLDDPRTLIAVTAATNRSKSDSDPSAWRPPDDSYWCRYVTDWMAVKIRWGLSVDPIEFTALQYLVTTSC